MNYCTNPNCKSLTYNPKFCSKSCATSYNNKKVPKRQAKNDFKKCAFCGTSTKNPKYCSITCQGKHKTQARFELIEKGQRNPDKDFLIYYRSHQCEVCKNNTWNNKPIPIELDHINGNHEDNSFGNLRLICPNCHAQTETYKAKNQGNGRYYRKERYAQGKSF